MSRKTHLVGSNSDKSNILWLNRVVIPLFFMSTTDIRSGINERLLYIRKKTEDATVNDVYKALCYAVRDRMVSDYLDEKPAQKEVAYLSAEFLIGPQLGNNLFNLDIQRSRDCGKRIRIYS